MFNQFIKSAVISHILKISNTPFMNRLISNIMPQCYPACESTVHYAKEFGPRTREMCVYWAKMLSMSVAPSSPRRFCLQAYTRINNYTRFNSAKNSFHSQMPLSH